MQKKIKVTGELSVEVEDNKLVLTASQGAVAVTVMDGNFMNMWMWHPLSGWLIHNQFPVGGKDEPDEVGRIEIGG